MSNDQDTKDSLPTTAQFSSTYLAWVGGVLALLTVVTMVIIATSSVPDSLESTSTTTLTDPNGTTKTVVELVATNAFAVRAAKWLSGFGIAAITMGVWLQAASMRVDQETTSLKIRSATGFAAVLTAVGDFLSKLTPPVALVFVGAALLLMSGFISIEMVPTRDGSALSNITFTTPESSSGQPIPDASPAATSDPTPTPTTTPSAGPPSDGAS